MTAREFPFGSKEFNSVRQRIRTLTGINLSESKDSLVYSRLARRIRALRLRSFDDYLNYLDTHNDETEHFINALTTNLTSFFREPHHFEVLKKFLIKNPQEINIWCAACSSGQEPYSIAMTCVEARGHFNPNINIYASDIDSNMLDKAKAGVYTLEQVQALSLERKKQFFYKGKGANDGLVKVAKELRQMIQFQQINLLDDGWQIPRNIDILFCRNVMIYFDKDTQLTIIEKMKRHMTAKSLYFAGHSENFSHVSNILKPLGGTVYRPVYGG